MSIILPKLLQQDLGRRQAFVPRQTIQTIGDIKIFYHNSFEQTTINMIKNVMVISVHGSFTMPYPRRNIPNAKIFEIYRHIIEDRIWHFDSGIMNTLINTLGHYLVSSRVSCQFPLGWHFQASAILMAHHFHHVFRDFAALWTYTRQPDVSMTFWMSEKEGKKKEHRWRNIKTFW